VCGANRGEGVAVWFGPSPEPRRSGALPPPQVGGPLSRANRGRGWRRSARFGRFEPKPCPTAAGSLLTTDQRMLTLGQSLLTTDQRMLTLGQSLLTTDQSLLTTDQSLQTAHRSLQTAHQSLQTTDRSLLTTDQRMLTTGQSLLSAARQQLERRQQTPCRGSGLPVADRRSHGPALRDSPQCGAKTRATRWPPTPSHRRV
jgi:hypothetical protein